MSAIMKHGHYAELVTEAQLTSRGELGFGPNQCLSEAVSAGPRNPHTLHLHICKEAGFAFDLIGPI